MLPSGFYHGDLRMMPSFHVLGFGDPLRGNGFRMMQNLVADFVFVETINESFRYFHTQPLMQIITFQGDLYFPDPAHLLTCARVCEVGLRAPARCFRPAGNEVTRTDCMYCADRCMRKG